MEDTQPTKTHLFDPEVLMGVLRKCPIGILMVDSIGVIVDVNPKAVLMMQYHADEMIGQVIHMLVPEPLREKHKEFVKLFMDNPRERAMGGGDIALQLSAQRKDGTMIPVRINLAPIQSSKGLVTIAYVERLDANHA